MYSRNDNRGGREVCKFFLQGRCKFGETCKNEHPSGGGGLSNGSNGNRFAPLQNDGRARSGAVSGNGGHGGQGQASPLYGITAEGIRLDLTDNKQKGERPQWEFSAYAPGVGAPRQLLEGQVEQSEEEMRVMCYLAKATGQLQAYDQHVNGLRNEMNSQIQRILNDTEGAQRYVQEGEHQQPNRISSVLKSNRDFPWENKPGSKPQQGAPFGQVNGSSSGFGQQRPAVSGFGQTSTLGGATPFGKPSALGGGAPTAFGQASSLGGPKPAFGQPAFGQASQPASTSFGQASRPAATAFGQPSQPATNVFGQTSQQPGTAPFGQSSQPAAPAFGQPSQPAANPFGQAPTKPAATPFGQTNQPAATPFGSATKPATNPFGQATQPAAANTFGSSSTFGTTAPATPAFGGSPFGQQSPATTFGQASQPATTFGQASQPATTFGQASQPATTFGQSTQPVSGFGGASISSQQPQTAAGFGVQAGAGVTPSVNTTGMFQNQRLYKHDKNDSLLINVRKDGVERATRVWFVNGPPTTAAPDTEGFPGEYEGEKGALLKEIYDQVKATGEFPGGFMPECPPKREWVSFDL